MINKLEKEYVVPVSCCDHNAQFSFVGIFNAFMDIATDHACLLGIGNNSISKDGIFWVAAKTRIRIKRRPFMQEKLKLATWPEAPGNIRCNRYCTISDADGVIAEGKTEWTIVDAVSGRPQKAKDIYPKELVHLTDVVCEEPFLRFKTDFTDCEEIATHIVNSSDIDMSRHMNNVAYIRAVLSVFSLDELDRMNISDIEIAYKAQCYEGEKLSIRKTETENGMEIGVLKTDGACAAVLNLK